MTGQILYISATPAEFEIANSVVGNTGYMPHERERIGQDEAFPAAIAGSGPLSFRRWRMAPRRSSRSFRARICRWSSSTCTRPRAPLVVEQIIRPDRPARSEDHRSAR